MASEQTEVELWPEKGEERSEFMARCVADLSKCIGPKKAPGVCASKWRKSEKLGKKAAGQTFVTRGLDADEATESCGATCVCGGTADQRERIKAESRATLERLDGNPNLRPRAPGSNLSDVLEDPVAKWAREGREQERARQGAKRLMRQKKEASMARTDDEFWAAVDQRVWAAVKAERESTNGKLLQHDKVLKKLLNLIDQMMQAMDRREEKTASVIGGLVTRMTMTESANGPDSGGAVIRKQIITPH